MSQSYSSSGCSTLEYRRHSGVAAIMNESNMAFHSSCSAIASLSSFGSL